jgi:predicted Zn-dependent peptidase
MYLSARCLAADFEKTFALAADAFTAPALPPEEIEKVRSQVLAELEQLQDTPHGEANLFFHRTFFADSPYRFPVQGTPEVVGRLKRDDLAAWHKRLVAGGNLVVAIFGGIDAAKAERLAAEALARVPKDTDLEFPRDIPPPKVQARQVHVKATEKKTAVVYVAYPAFDLLNLRDRFPMDVLDTVLSGYRMPEGWLHEGLRGKGLVYEVHAYTLAGLRPGYFAAYAVCQPEKAAEVVRIIEAAMARAHSEAFSEQAIAPARATIITSQELGRETVAGRSFEAAIDECLGLGYGFAREEIGRIRQVKPEDVARVAREYLKAPVICILTSDPKAVEPPAK